MTEFYQEMQGIASELLAEFDQGDIYYIALVPGNGPPDNPGPSTQVPYKIDAAARGVKYKYVMGGLALASDLQCTMAVRPDVVPDMKGKVRLGTIDYKIIQIMPIPPSGTTVAHRLIFRK